MLSYVTIADWIEFLFYIFSAKRLDNFRKYLKKTEEKNIIFTVFSFGVSDQKI